MYYIDFLARLHHLLSPRTYLEIGVRRGHSLALSKCRSIGIDPNLQIDQVLGRDTRLVETTSDEYFADLHARDAAPFARLPVDLAFIDGMHLFEYALRDFANVERHAGPNTVVVFDDMFPRNVDEAARDRHTQEWTGDVFRVMLALDRHRPDLTLTRVDTQPTGLLLVTGFSAERRFTSEEVESIVAKELKPDPQSIPSAVLTRKGALAPEDALDLPLWPRLASSRAPRHRWFVRGFRHRA